MYVVSFNLHLSSLPDWIFFVLLRMETGDLWSVISVIADPKNRDGSVGIRRHMLISLSLSLYFGGSKYVMTCSSGLMFSERMFLFSASLELLLGFSAWIFFASIFQSANILYSICSRGISMKIFRTGTFLSLTSSFSIEAMNHLSRVCLVFP